MKKNNLAILLGITTLTLSSLVVFKTNDGFKSLKGEGDVCVHEGFHYEELSETETTVGHKEFWSCCKCHESFLEEPEIGNFTNQEDAEMIGGVYEGHIAFLPPDPFLKFGVKSTSGSRTTYVSDDQTCTAKIGNTDVAYLDCVYGIVKFIVGIENPILTDGERMFEENAALHVKKITRLNEEYDYYVNRVDKQYQDKIRQHNLSILEISVEAHDGYNYRFLDEAIHVSVQKSADSHYIEEGWSIEDLDTALECENKQVDFDGEAIQMMNFTINHLSLVLMYL